MRSQRVIRRVGGAEGVGVLCLYPQQPVAELYVGMTNNLRGRVLRHRDRPVGTHTERYNIHRLVYFERYQYVRSAIARETEMKSWTREKKVALIEKVNPTWEDLAESLGAAVRKAGSSLRSE